MNNRTKKLSALGVALLVVIGLAIYVWVSFSNQNTTPGTTISAITITPTPSASTTASSTPTASATPTATPTTTAPKPSATPTPTSKCGEGQPGGISHIGQCAAGQATEATTLDACRAAALGTMFRAGAHTAGVFLDNDDLKANTRDCLRGSGFSYAHGNPWVAGCPGDCTPRKEGGALRYIVITGSTLSSSGFSEAPYVYDAVTGQLMPDNSTTLITLVQTWNNSFSEGGG